MRAKQVLAKVFASAMVFSTLFGTSVMADEIESGTIYVDQEVIDVTLPTTASQKFYIDPQGLIAVGGGGAATNKGTVTGATDMFAINNSSIPVALSVAYKLIDSAESDGVTVVSSVDDSGATIQGATTRQIAVSVTAAEDPGTSEYTGHVVKSAGATTNMSSLSAMSADVVYATDTTAASATYLMEGATYKVQKKEGATDVYDSDSYEYVRDESATDASRLKLTIGGYCSTKADWSDYASGDETLTLDVVFGFKKVTSTLGDYTDAAVGAEISVGPKVEISASGVITLSGLTADNTISSFSSVKVIWPESSYTLVNGASTFVPDTTQYNANSGTITITLPASVWSSTINNKSVKVEVTLTGGSKIESNSVTISYT